MDESWSNFGETWRKMDESWSNFGERKGKFNQTERKGINHQSNQSTIGKQKITVPLIVQLVTEGLLELILRYHLFQ